MKFYFSNASKGRLNTVHPDLQALAHRALEISNVDFGIPSSGGKRNTAEQQSLLKAGKSYADGIKKLSKHQSGNALDFFAVVDGKASWAIGDLAQVAAAFLQAASEKGVVLKWGGHWKGWKDCPHVELAYPERLNAERAPYRP